MLEFLMPILLTCGPFAFSTFSLIDGIRSYQKGRLGLLPLFAIGCAWLVAAYSAGVFLYYTFRPGPFLPPWKDPKTLDLGLLFLLAPIGIAATVFAGQRGASRWVILTLLGAMLVLLFVGLLAAASV